MRFILCLLFAGFLALPTSNATSTLSDVIVFASQEEGRKLLGTEDAYTDTWSEFDIVSRLQDKQGTKAELIDFGKDQVLQWSEKEKEKIAGLLRGIDKSMTDQNLMLPLPDRIPLIKSTLKEEGGAVGYTRLNYIVLRQDVIFMEDDFLVKLILHEVFHVLTRGDAEFRKQIYGIIGFEVGNPISYPAALAQKRITNPDAHASDSHIRLAGPQGDSIDVVMILYANRPYEGGAFFQYLSIGFMVVEGKPGDKVAKMVDGEPVVYSIQEVDGFMEKIGMNTQYILDPEEIMADNFAFAVMNKVDMPSQDIIDQILDLLVAQ